MRNRAYIEDLMIGEKYIHPKEFHHDKYLMDFVSKKH